MIVPPLLADAMRRPGHAGRGHPRATLAGAAQGGPDGSDEEPACRQGRGSLRGQPAEGHSQRVGHHLLPRSRHIWFPKRAILQIPKNHAGPHQNGTRTRKSSVGRISTPPTAAGSPPSRSAAMQAEGNEPLAEETRKFMGTCRNLMVATYQGRPDLGAAAQGTRIRNREMPNRKPEIISHENNRSACSSSPHSVAVSTAAETSDLHQFHPPVPDSRPTSFGMRPPSVEPQGQQLSALAINPGGARFELWTVRITRRWSAICWIPPMSAPMCRWPRWRSGPRTRIRLIPRTRADRPFYVDYHGLRPAERSRSDPAASKRVKLLRTSSPTGWGARESIIDRTQATLLSQATINTNGTANPELTP